MARDRANTGFGPSALTVVGTTAAADASEWMRWGPVKGVNMASIYTFSSGSSNGSAVKLQTRISSGSTRGQLSWTVVKASAPTAVQWGTTGMVCFVRAYSSALANGDSVAVTIAGVI